MAFIMLRRSQNACSYVLAERYCDDHGRERSRVVCHLGHEEDGTDTLEKARADLERVRRRTEEALPAATGNRRVSLERRLAATEAKLALITQHQAAAVAAAGKGEPE